MINGAIAVVVWFVTLTLAVPFGMWAVWPTAEKHGYRRGYTEGHKRADREQPALPVAGRLPVDQQTDVRPGIKGRDDPDYSPAAPPWRFAGESVQGWAAESAEYELLTQTAELDAVPGVDTPSDFIDSMTAEIDAMVAEHARQTNLFIHSMPRVIIEAGS